MTENRPTRAFLPDYYGPNGFHWLVPGLIGGTPLPGLFKTIDQDLEALQRVGVRLLVTLTEEWAPDAQHFASYGVESLFMPIPDRGVPDTVSALRICEIVHQSMRRGHPVVHHCRAGKGRTGTLIAAQLIYCGVTAKRAIDVVRAKNRYWIESEEQLAFLHHFGGAVSEPREFPPLTALAAMA